MSGLRIDHHRSDIVAEKERLIERSVEQEIKLMLGMCLRDARQRGTRKNPYSLQFVF